jgi:hypothetical protein
MSLQASADRPWLIRAAYFLTENDMKILKLPGSELSSRSNPVYFSRLFLSKWLGGSQHPAYATVKFNQNRAYHLAAYYFGKQDWNPQYPKRTGENGALLVVGKSHEEPPVPWRTTGEASPVGHRAILKPINCFVKRSPAEYKYIGCYVIHDEFRKLTEKDVEQHVPRATRDLWINGIDTSQWGAKVKGKQEVKKAEELFKLPDDNPHKLCFYWQVWNSLLEFHDRLTPSFSTLNTSAMTKACTMLSVRKEKKSAGQQGNPFSRKG